MTFSLKNRNFRARKSYFRLPVFLLYVPVPYVYKAEPCLIKTWFVSFSGGNMRKWCTQKYITYLISNAFPDDKHSWPYSILGIPLQWRHNYYDGVSNRLYSIVCSTVLFKPTSKKTSNPALLALCEGNPSVTGGFPSQKPVTFDDVRMIQ